MRFAPKEILLKNGKICVLRSAQPDDAADLIQYMKITAEETRYLLREPNEAAQSLTVEREREFIQYHMSAPRGLMLIARVDGQLAGACSVSSTDSLRRHAHRCSLAIALYRSAWGQGIAAALLEAALAVAKDCGYEQAELEVVTTNAPAIHLYQKFGFQIQGTQRRSMKYADGTYADCHWMAKPL